MLTGSIVNIREHAPRGSTLCFDYITGKMDSANPGEPCLFWISSGEMVLFLGNYGVRIDDHVDPATMERRYLALPDGSTAEKLPPDFRFVHGTLQG